MAEIFHTRDHDHVIAVGDSIGLLEVKLCNSDSDKYVIETSC